MADLQLTREPSLIKIIPASSGITINSNHGIKYDDPRLTKALFKASMDHKSLSPADEAILAKIFSNVNELKIFLSIKGKNFAENDPNSSGCKNDKDPLRDVPDRGANKANKHANFVDETIQLEKRLKVLLGDKYSASGIKEKIDDMKTALEYAQELGTKAEDTFSKETEYRLGDRARLNPEKKGNEKLQAVDDDVIALVFMGIGATKDPKVKGLFETPVSTETFRITNIPKTNDAKAWLAYLSQAQADGFPAADQKIPRSLLRKLRNLEQEPDLQTFRELTRCLKFEVDDEIAKDYQELFNNSVTDLKNKAKAKTVDLYEYDSDKELLASLESMKIDISKLNLTSDQSITLGRAYRFLSENNLEIDKLLDKKVITDAIPILNTIPDFETDYGAKKNTTTDTEKKIFLKQVLSRITIDYKDKDPETTRKKADINPTTEDPLKLYQDFAKTMEYLHAEINDPARSEANRENLKKEFERFFSSGEVGSLGNEFKEKPEVATALNLFRYDPKNLGLIKSLFNRTDPKSKVPPFNIINLIRNKNNQDLSDIARGIEEAVTASGNNNVNQVPPELMDLSVKVKTEHVLLGSAFNPDFKPDPDPKIKKGIPQSSFPLFTKLGLDKFLTTGKIKLDEGKMVTINEQGKPEKLPGNLRTLLDATMASIEADNEMNDEELLEVLTEGKVLTKNGDNYAFNEDSRKLLMYSVANGASVRHNEYDNYEGYNPDTKISFEKLLEQRKKLVELSHKYGLGIFRAVPARQSYDRSEYRDSLISLAVNLPHLKGHYDTNIRPYEEDLNAKGERVLRPENVQSTIFGIDPSKGKNIERRTSALNNSNTQQMYADLSHMRELTQEVLNSLEAEKKKPAPLLKPPSEELADITHIRALTKQIFDSFLDDDRSKRSPFLFDFDEPTTKDDPWRFRYSA